MYFAADFVPPIMGPMDEDEWEGGLALALLVLTVALFGGGGEGVGGSPTELTDTAAYAHDWPDSTAQDRNLA